MENKTLLDLENVPSDLLASLEARDIALWVRSLPRQGLETAVAARFLGMPWRLVLCEQLDNVVITELSKHASITDPLTKKRGFVQIVRSDASRIELPPRSLPIYLLAGMQAETDFESRLRRMTMLDALRRAEARHVLVIDGDEDPVPPELDELWRSGFRSLTTFISGDSQARSKIDAWLQRVPSPAVASLVRKPPADAIAEIIRDYSAIYPEDRIILRVRGRQGDFEKRDVTQLDEPERPILERYSLIQERDLAPLVPEELSEEELNNFFKDPTASWKPYAAGLPWIRDTKASKTLDGIFSRLDAAGAEENCIAYIASEAGAGGTTLARHFAWEYARRGYPVLVAKPVPFVPDALAVSNFMNRVRNEFEPRASQPSSQQPDGATDAAPVYEAPWLVVFDSLHWQHRDSELARFRNDLEREGRPACILVVTGPVLGLSYFNTSIFKCVTELNHSLEQEEARQLGRHLNKFLRIYNRDRKEWQWDQFYEQHTVRYLEGVAAFWVTLSFWLQGQYNISESIQEWMYRSFKANAKDETIRAALLEIAALSSERLPMPEELLPQSKGKWPISHLLMDARAEFANLGLTRITADGRRHWALVHDILGRFLINALFYDFEMRTEMGYSGATDAEHLRFIILRQISQKQQLGEREFRPLGEDFATSIFKVDPDHGRGAFTLIWRQVLAALDAMPKSLRDTSRVFRHHASISRRRIAKLDERLFGLTLQERFELVSRAVEDLTYALQYIDYTAGSEPDLNLFNSLANAYFDLANIEVERDAPRERVNELRRLANEYTRRAYMENPTNSFVIETYVKNLLEATKQQPELAIDHCIEALGIVYSALASGQGSYRRTQLGDLADVALATLLQQAPLDRALPGPRSAIDVLVSAWRALASGSLNASFDTLLEVPVEARVAALEALAHPAGRGNMQVIRLTYDLTSTTHPYTFKRQLELIEQLHATDYRMTPQLRLEYAILLYQNSRAIEGERIFKALRRLWAESEQFVHVPDRLRWLRGLEGTELQVVHATVGSDFEHRPMARVREFGNERVPFRPEEHGFRDVRPRLAFSCHVSFGHNGPFLRPTTVRPKVVERA